MTVRPAGDPSFEHRDVHARTVLLSGALILAGLLLSFGFVAFCVSLLRPDQGPEIAREAVKHGVRLETGSPDVLNALREKAAGRLTGYSWVDKGDGRARIPIERAMELLADRGWPETSSSRDGGRTGR